MKSSPGMKSGVKLSRACSSDSAALILPSIFPLPTAHHFNNTPANNPELDAQQPEQDSSTTPLQRRDSFHFLQQMSM